MNRRRNSDADELPDVRLAHQGGAGVELDLSREAHSVDEAPSDRETEPSPEETTTGPHHDVPEMSDNDKLLAAIGNLLDDKLDAKFAELKQSNTESIGELRKDVQTLSTNVELTNSEVKGLQQRLTEHERSNGVEIKRLRDEFDEKLEALKADFAKRLAVLEAE